MGFICLANSSAQSIKVGDWRDHLSYHRATDVCMVDEKIYASTEKALIVYDQTDQSIARLNTLSGLSDSEISSIASYEGGLVIGYENGNIDLIEEGATLNIPDLKRASLFGSKRVNHIQISEKNAYLSCGFGIIVLNLDKREVSATFFIGENGSRVNVLQTSIVHNRIYAATETGLYYAAIDATNLSDYSAWEKLNTPSDLKVSFLANFNELLFVNFAGRSYNTDKLFYFNGLDWVLFDEGNSNSSIQSIDDEFVLTRRFGVLVFDAFLNQKEFISSAAFETLQIDFNTCLFVDGGYWIADNYQGLLYANKNRTEVIMPSGPYHSDVAQIKNLGDEIWLAHGSVSENWDPSWHKREISMLKSDLWSMSTNLLSTGFQDVVAINQHGGDTYLASWQSGLAKMKGVNLEAIYNETNSSLQKRAVYEDWIEIGDIQFDRQGNLWCTNSQTYEPLSVKYTNGTWESFSIGAGVSENQDLAKLLIDKNNQKWIQLKNNGLVVFDEARSGVKSRKLMNGEQNGNLASDRVFAITEDLKGNVWVGTDNGVSVYYNPEEIFEGESASKIKVTKDGYTTYLLDGQQINDIEVDGANRKWFAMNNGGVLVTSENGTEELYHFTTENSPLFSNKVVDIEINEVTGEAFFATDKGLISYRAEATKGSNSFSQVMVFPNPVRPDYDGLITIKGLLTDAVVKITDISGSLIYQTTALGGQATWDGRSFDGKKAQTGVYLIFCSDEDGNMSHVTKLLFVRG